MFDKLASIESEYEELLRSLGSAQVQNDQAEYRKQAKHLSEIEPTVERYREYKSVASDIAALMVFEHQMHMMNLITRVGWPIFSMVSCSDRALRIVASMPM